MTCITNQNARCYPRKVHLSGTSNIRPCVMQDLIKTSNSDTYDYVSFCSTFPDFLAVSSPLQRLYFFTYTHTHTHTYLHIHIDRLVGLVVSMSDY